MTHLDKTIRRETDETSHAGRSLIVEIHPGSTVLVVVREKGRRKGYAVPLERVYKLGARLEAERRISDRAAKRKAKKKQQASR